MPLESKTNGVSFSGPSELKLQITITTDKTVLDLKQAIAEKSDVPADRQRLIYSGECASRMSIGWAYLHRIHLQVAY